MKKSVYIVGGDASVAVMFGQRGWETWQTPPLLGQPDLICFTGGADVSPHMYGEENISSHCDPIRDEFEKQVYETYVGKVPMIGVCRGGQFLNVMNGGKMIQHKSGYSMRKINASFFDTLNIQPMHVDHHQVMRQTDGALTVAVYEDTYDPVALWYEDTRCLCFQPHPEWGHEPTLIEFFRLLEDYIFPAPIAALTGEMGIAR